MSDDDAFRLLDMIVEKERELDALRRTLAGHRARMRFPEGALCVLRCRLGGSDVAFRESDIDEVVAMAELERLPGAPSWFVGLLRVGSTRIPVIDILAREGGARRELDPDEFIVLARSSRGRLGIIVDAIFGLSNIASEDVHRPSSELPFAPYVVGVFGAALSPTLLLCTEPLMPEPHDPDAPR